MEDVGLTTVIRARARHYLPGAERARAPIEVRHLGATLRRWSRLDHYELRQAPVGRRLVVKRARLDGGPPEPSTRARLAPPVEAESRIRLEYEALTAIDVHLCALADPRLARIPVLDRLEDGGIVMEEIVARPLAGLLVRSAGPLATRDRALEDTFRHAGAWLRTFARLPGLAELGPRLTTREDVITTLTTLATDLAERGEDPRLLRLVAARGATWAERLLPASLPLALGHGDFATRNVLVDPAGRVAVIDTRARWRPPIYEDVASLLVSLRAGRLQALSRGAAFPRSRLEPIEAAFLAGRFEGEPIPRDQIRLFELLVLLDRWSAVSAGPKARRWSGIVVSRLVRRHYAGLAGSLVTALDNAAT